MHHDAHSQGGHSIYPGENRCLIQEYIHEVRTEWVFAAMVVDRICFISFSVFLLITISTIAYKAPHLFV